MCRALRAEQGDVTSGRAVQRDTCSSGGASSPPSRCCQPPWPDLARSAVTAAASLHADRTPLPPNPKPCSSLYPNVDFYSGIVLRALGIPVEMYTVLFAMARTVGWVAQASTLGAFFFSFFPFFWGGGGRLLGVWRPLRISSPASRKRAVAAASGSLSLRVQGPLLPALMHDTLAPRQ